MTTLLTTAEAVAISQQTAELHQQIRATRQRIDTLQAGAIASALREDYPELRSIRCYTELDDNGLGLYVSMTYDRNGNDATEDIDPADIDNTIGQLGYTETLAHHLTGLVNLDDTITAARALLP